MKNILETVKYPSKILQTPCAPVTDEWLLNKSAVQRFKNRAGLIMKREKGLAIAAPQVGIRARVFLVDGPSFDLDVHLLVVANPEITYQSPETIVDEEECLSIPGFVAEIERPKEVEITYSPPGRSGVKVVWHSSSPLMARMFCHEIDHLDGKLIR